MGCNRSNPFTPIASRSKTNSSDMRAIKKTSFISKRFGPISKYFDLKVVLGSHDTYSTFKAIDKESSATCTVKEISKSSKFQSESINDEVSILSELDHPNILKILETIESSRSLYLVYEYIDGGLLKDNIKRNGDEVKAAKFISDVLSGINYMHKNGFIHCDLNIDNVLISTKSNEKIAKIIGFSCTRHKDSPIIAGLEKISPYFASPELLSTGIFNTQTDIWSVGVILYSVLVGKLPFVSRTLDETLDEILTGKLDFSNPNYQGLSVAARDLISKMLELNPRTRITAEEALNHVWVSLGREPFTINFNTLNRLKNFRVKSNLVRCFLAYYTFKMNLEENEIVKCFKEIDKNFDGFVSQDELVSTFGKYGIDISQDISDIMKNIDIDQSGVIDYTELKIVLTDWTSQIKKKNLRNLFNMTGDLINLSSLITDLPQVLPSEWKEFCAKTRLKDNLVPLTSIKQYILSFLNN